MKLPGFVPEELRQLARFVPLRGWDAIEWKPLLGSMRSVSWRYVTGRGVDNLRRSAEGEISHIAWAADLQGAEPLADIEDAEQLRALGDDVLRLYFAQLLRNDGLFLDLRSGRFAVRGDTLVYAPNGLWLRLRPEFRAGMLALYRSFYSADDAAFDVALRRMGLLRAGLSADSESELKALLHAHFGIDQRAQHFSIETFKTSFDELFEFFIRNGYQLHSDFVWVGFYLITLYLNLQQGGQCHDVRSICFETLQKSPS